MVARNKILVSKKNRQLIILRTTLRIEKEGGVFRSYLRMISASYFAFDEIKTSVRDIQSIAKLRGVLPRQTQHAEWHHGFTEEIYTIAREGVSRI